MQLKLDLFQTEQNRNQAEALEGILWSDGGWVSAKEILRRMGLPSSESAKRDIRRLANGTPCVISGVHGYRHLDRASTSEVSHSIQFYESQAREMFARANRLRRRAHSRIG